MDSIIQFGSRLPLESKTTTASVVLFTATFALTYWVMQSRQTKRRYPPALRSLPIVGSAPFLPEFSKQPEFFRQTALKLKSSIFSLYLGSDYAIVLNGREAITEALVKRSGDFADKKAPYTTTKYLNPHLRGILNAQYNPEFKRKHQLVLNILRDYGFGKRIMEERIHTETEDLIERINNLNGVPFDPSEYLNICTINVINSIAFGQRLPQSHPTLERMTKFYHFFINSSKRVIDFCPPLLFLPKYKAILKEVMEKYNIQHDFLVKSVEENLTTDSDSFVKQYAEREGEKFDLLELKQILNDLLAAGSETTATSIHWAIYLLANNQNIQRRIREEIDSVIPRNRLPRLDDMASLPYVEAAILELMRVKTVAPLSLIRYTMCDTQVAGYFVPAKTKVISNIYSVHMDPNEWPEPEVFRPERFLDSEGHVVGKDRIIPFSLGKRSCLGELLARQELFLLFSALVQRFNILPPEGQDKVHCEPKLMLSYCPQPFLVRLVPIED